MRPLVRGARAIWRVLWRSKQLDADMQEEMRFHLEMEADRRYRAHGLVPRRRGQAFVRFGGVEQYKEEGREARVSIGWTVCRWTRASASGCWSSIAG